MRRSSVRLLLAGTAALLLSMALIRSAVGTTPLTACPYRRGYAAVPDFALTTDETTVPYDTVTEAEEACTADPECRLFNNYGEVYSTLEVNSKRADGVCTYMKIDCPAVAGHVVLPRGMTWDTAGADAGLTVQDADPQAYCAAHADCVAWNTDGYVALADSFGMLTSVSSDTDPVCTYVPDPCPFKFGFSAFPGRSITPGVGLDGVDIGAAGSQADAEAYCKINPKCTAFSSDGSYSVGGFTSLPESDSVKCTYFKLPCPPLNGYTAYDDVANDPRPTAAFPPAAYYPNLCFADMARNCSADSECMVFDLLRYVWRTDVVHYNPFPGMCTYRKAEGFYGIIDGSRRRRLRALEEAAVTATAAADSPAYGVDESPTAWVLYMIHFLNPAMHTIVS